MEEDSCPSTVTQTKTNLGLIQFVHNHYYNNHVYYVHCVV